MNLLLVKAAGYVRCSTDQQEDSPEQQKREILAFAAKNGYEIVEWFEDFGESGITFDQRPTFQRMLKVVESGPTFRCVICYDESRWGRAINPEENTYWRVHFDKRGVKVLLVKTAVDPNHDLAPMLKAFEGMQASQYSKKLSELTLRGASNNGKFSSGGTAPYGYRRVAVSIKTSGKRDLQDGQWSVKKQEKVLWIIGDPSEVETVKTIFEQRAAGIALIVIAKTLNDRRVPCARRGRWRNKDQKWSTGSIKSILENPTYYGARAYNRYSSSKIRAHQEGWERRTGVNHPQWRMDPSTWKMEENAHEAIVSKELWQRANSRRHIGHIAGHPRHFVPYLLSGLITCSRCGFSFQGQSTRLESRSYYRYICGGYNSKRVCTYCGINRDYLERAVVEGIEELLAQNCIVEKIERRLSERLNLQMDGRGAIARNLERELQEISDSIQNITVAIEKGAPFELFSTRLQDLEARKRSVEMKKRENLETEERKERIREVAQRVVDFSSRFRSDFESSSHDKRKQLVQRCVERIVVDRSTNKVRCYFRRIPLVEGPGGDIIEALEKAKRVPESMGPFRNSQVPGTRTFDHSHKSIG